MIDRLSHTSIYVLNQEDALKFYRDKLGFEVRTDHTMGAFRWITVGPKSQPDLELVLMPIAAGPMMDESSAAQLRELVKKGSFGIGVFETTDVHGTYEELKKKGVEFKCPPTERPYGVETVVKDSSGNWFSLVQRQK